MARRHSAPKPVIVSTVCSLCGLDWERHPESPSKDDCIDLLKADLAKASRRTVVAGPAKFYPLTVGPNVLPETWKGPPEMTWKGRPELPSITLGGRTASY